ncbi:MAG: response regulator [Lentisphaerae bacterium]|nr:response regulator [Lentisphaerota bacterium]
MRIRVFVFDDEPTIRRVFATVARRRGYEVEVFGGAAPCGPPESMCTCSSGERCADAMITDYNMPGMNGLDLVLHFRARGCRCPAMAMVSGFLTAEVAARAKELGLAVFSKPVSWKDLEAWLASHCEAIPPDRRLTDHYPTGPAAAFRDPQE